MSSETPLRNLTSLMGCNDKPPADRCNAPVKPYIAKMATAERQVLQSDDGEDRWACVVDARAGDKASRCKGKPTVAATVSV